MFDNTYMHVRVLLGFCQCFTRITYKATFYILYMVFLKFLQWITPIKGETSKTTHVYFQINSNEPLTL